MKRFFLLFLISVMLVTVCCCSNGTANNSSAPIENSNVPEKTPAQSVEPSPSKEQEPLTVNKDNCSYETGLVENEVENYHELIDENEESDQSKELDIPIYYDEEFILGAADGLEGYGHNPIFNPGLDNGARRYPIFTSELLAAFPNNAWRDMGGGKKYLV